MSRQHVEAEAVGTKRAGFPRLTGFRAGLAVWLLLAGGLAAQARADDNPAATASPAVAGEPEAETSEAFAGLVPVSLGDLGEARGGERMVLNLAEITGSVEDNTIEGTVTTGAATVSGDAFQDLNGVSSVIINSGNNVSIQSSTTVNIVIE